MAIHGAQLFAGLVDACVVESGAPMPGLVMGQVVGVDLGADANGVYVLGSLCQGGFLRVYQCGSLGESGLSSCYDRIAVHLGLRPLAWVMGWDAEVKQSLFNLSPAGWLRQRQEEVKIVRESVDMSLSRLGRALGRGPSDLRVEIDAECARLVSSLRHYRASPGSVDLDDDGAAWARHMVDALRYVVTPDWRNKVGRHASAVAVTN